MRVHLPRANRRPLCCGRTFLAASLVDDARLEAKRFLEAVGPFVEKGMAVIGLEPSCLYTLRDEFKVMSPGPETDALADRAQLLEEYLAAEAAAGRLELPLMSPWPGAGPCCTATATSKAFAAMGAVERALGLVPGLEVETVESSCCGMAGAFGFEAEHYDMSMKMGELSLLPAVRAAAADTVICADGTSCRHQIRSGTGRRALHMARILESALVSSD